MTKPKDRTGAFMRQHKRILEERTELLAKLETYDQQKAKDIAAALAPIAAEAEQARHARDQALEQAERFRASNKILEKDLDIERGKVLGISAALAHERQERAAEKAALEAQIAAHAPALARLEELVTRWEGRAKKAEYEEARALLNRQALAGVVPGVNRRT